MHMDAVAELKQTFAPTYGSWCSELPAVLAEGPRAFKQWAEQYPTLHATASDLGLDLSKIVSSVEIGISLPGDGAGTGRTRMRPRARARRRTSNAHTEPVSGEQIVAFLREHPGSPAKRIADGLGGSYDTVQRRLRELASAGKVRREGERQDTQFFAVELAGAGAGGR
jgi:DNA-binding transcriptional ArsR family regulator